VSVQGEMHGGSCSCSICKAEAAEIKSRVSRNYGDAYEQVGYDRKWLLTRVEFLEEMGAECAQDWQKIERLVNRIAQLEAALREIAENEDCRYASCGIAARAALAGSQDEGGTES
jgi:hypothetical protein